MTDIQIPLQQAHQKGMNGKFLPTAKNTLEMYAYYFIMTLFQSL